MTSGIAHIGGNVLNSRLALLGPQTIARGLCALLLFVLAAGNAYWYAWNSLMPSLVLAPLIWVSAVAANRDRPRLRRSAVWLTLAFGGLFLLATLSLAVNDKNPDGPLQWLGSYVSPLLVLIAVQAVPLDAAFCRRCWLAITAGALIPLCHGLVRYYMEWGLPSGAELLLSRYSVERMATYMKATYGNTGNTAAYMTLVIPMWIALALARGKASPAERLLFGLAMLIALANVLIVQSRTLFLVLTVMLPCLLYFLRIRGVWVAVGLGLIGGILLLPILSAWDQFVELTLGAFSGTESDSSVSERFEAMQYGLRTLGDSPAFGLGPGNTMITNPHTSAHQFWIQQGSELGIWGLLIAVWLSFLVLGKFALCAVRRSAGIENFSRFIFLAGPSAYILYGCLANMPLSQNVVNSWIGLFAVMAGLSTSEWTDNQRSDRAGAERIQ